MRPVDVRGSHHDVTRRRIADVADTLQPSAIESRGRGA
jgi:hypothetical protein